MGQEPHDRVAPSAEPSEVQDAEGAGTQVEPAPVDHGMRNTIIVIGGLIAVIALLAILMRAGDSTENPATPPAAVASYKPVVHTVSYEADGDGTNAGTYTLRSADGGTRQGEADLPLMNKAGGVGLQLTGFGSGAFLYLSVQNSNGYGAVTCRIVVDGQTISENTSQGGYTIATCQGQVP